MAERELSVWLAERVDSRTPTAMVRFGDGEVRLLNADADDPASIRVANNQLNLEMGHTCAPEVTLKLRAALEYAYGEADVLGIPPHVALQAARDKHPLAALYARRVATGRPPEALVAPRVNHAILAQLPELLAGRRVTVISCRDIKPVIEHKWGLKDVAIYQVPSQYRVREVDGAYETAMHDVSIWPDVHDRVLSDLTVREHGEIFLVGAGVFGKDLCIEVRERGGIALDMGAALDHIVGKATRSWTRLILELHAGGTAVPDIASAMEREFGLRTGNDRIEEFLKMIGQYAR